jgi:hypothetical protein
MFNNVSVFQYKTEGEIFDFEAKEFVNKIDKSNYHYEITFQKHCK